MTEDQPSTEETTTPTLEPLTPEEIKAVMYRARAAADEGRPWPAAELRYLLRAVYTVSDASLRITAEAQIASEQAESDAAKAHAELERRVALLDSLTLLPPGSIPTWRNEITAGLALLAIAPVDVVNVQKASLVDTLESFVQALTEIERLTAELARRDELFQRLEAKAVELDQRHEGLGLQLNNLESVVFPHNPDDPAPVIDGPATPASNPVVESSPETRSTDTTQPAGDRDLDWEGPGPEDVDTFFTPDAEPDAVPQPAAD